MELLEDPLELFGRRNFAVGNLETLAMYGGLSVTFFFLVLFLQQVAGYTALQAGLATMPTTIVMFLLSKRAGRLADRLGPRLFMGGGPLVAAVAVARAKRPQTRRCSRHWSCLMHTEHCLRVCESGMNVLQSFSIHGARVLLVIHPLSANRQTQHFFGFEGRAWR